MKHLAATISAILIPLLGIGSCSSQRAAALKAQQEKEKQEQEKQEKQDQEQQEQRDTVLKKRIESDFRNPTPVVYGPPPSVYQKMPEPVLEDNSKKN